MPGLMAVVITVAFDQRDALPSMPHDGVYSGHGSRTLRCSRYVPMARGVVKLPEIRRMPAAPGGLNMAGSGH